MIQRVNLLEKKRFQMTYAMLLMSVLGLFFLCAAAYGFQSLSQYQMKNKIVQRTADIERLKQERERLMNKESVLKGTGPYIEIQNILYKIPPWPALLNSLAMALPSNVWLSSFQTSTKQEGSIQREVKLLGSAKKPQALALFLKELEKSSYFEEVTLKQSQEKGGMFEFEIHCDISEGPWR